MISAEVARLSFKFYDSTSSQFDSWNLGDTYKTSRLRTNCYCAMQQPTPAPSEYPSSPPPARPRASRENVAAAEDHPITYIPPPPNVESAPFYVLSSLFDKLSTERKPEKRKKLLGSWFNVCSNSYSYELFTYPYHILLSTGAKRRDMIYTLFYD